MIRIWTLLRTQSRDHQSNYEKLFGDSCLPSYVLPKILLQDWKIKLFFISSLKFPYRLEKYKIRIYLRYVVKCSTEIRIKFLFPKSWWPDHYCGPSVRLRSGTESSLGQSEARAIVPGHSMQKCLELYIHNFNTPWHAELVLLLYVICLLRSGKYSVA